MTNNTKLNRGRLANGQPNPIDIHIGDRIRLRRTLLGLSQGKLAELLGITFQQVQKYERGMNRVSGSRLWDLSKTLDVPVSFFYEEIGETVAQQSPSALITGTVLSSNDYVDPMQRQEAINLVKNFYRINNRTSAKLLAQLVAEMAKSYYSDSGEVSDDE